MTNKEWSDIMEKEGIPYRGNVITFFLPGIDRNAFLCMSQKCPMKYKDILFDCSLRAYSYMNTLIIKSLTGVDMTSEIMGLERANTTVVSINKIIKYNGVISGYISKFNSITLWIANYMKFSNVKFEKKLADTGMKFLAYCNLNDKELGTYENKDIVSKRMSCSSIPGKNKVGNSLMEVRSDLEFKRKSSLFVEERKGSTTIAFGGVMFYELFSMYLHYVADLYDVKYKTVTIPDENNTVSISIKLEVSNKKIVSLVRAKIEQYPFIIPL